ncbi:hypothetical protein CFC21_002589 [Triticum aestivum]|uniref:Kinesin-like protein n=2 Tax=Triticum TaxID=4564 RepID=A0A9R0QAS1_TRITD|nr:kinesin-like protein KIN-14J [Triticum dicoccoides]XP_044334669.1 kinesin-like protein KIN-14J isoform X1 [Triticum aestivum]XP_044334678.1 kinesin-like protein KIN-14J isoform X2 [Triticum aestivum]KAF6984610.1 hypothetical protein CFC21_002589 [Triticum aestivum]VAH07153.1 unnamed protein product [Triticum turgidum subsp. durum]
MGADPAASPPSPAASPSRQPRQGEEELRAVEDHLSPSRHADSSPAPPPSPASAAPVPQHPEVSGEDAELASEEAVEEQPALEEGVVEAEAAVAGGDGEALRSFLEEFGDQADDCLIPSPRLKGIATPDCPAALQFLGGRYNSLMEKYKQQVAKCAEECAPRFDGLKKKYTAECAERRRLYNELIELRGNIRVFCRCRPLSSDEISRGCSSVVEVDPSQEMDLQFVPTEKERKTFKFDHVFGPADDQEAVFAESLPVVRSVMDGFNVCIFAYGQTGTGKTFTMEGVPENRGVNYRALEELFRISEERSSSVSYSFGVSILEVYNEKIRDLLDDNSEHTSKRLDIKQSADGAQEVPGLVEAPISTIDGVWEKLEAGARNRSVGSTSVNELSSRSHSLVRVTVTSEHLVTGERSRSHMWLVDLAGSERLAKTEVEGERLKEAKFINKSLSALGDVIAALASKNAHIPYRNSKLTHLLQSSLGGDCKTLMFVQISPSSTDSGETLCSLNFASRVRAIEHGPARKQVDPAENFKIKQMAEKLCHEEKENAKLNESLQLMQLKYASRENVFRTLQDKIRETEQACRTHQQRARELENELANEKKAARDTGKSAKPSFAAPVRQRPPLAPMRQRPPSNNMPQPSGPSRLRFAGKGSSVQNKENIPTTNKTTVDKTAGKARRVSLVPMMRQIPLQPKRRSSIAILPSERERMSIFPEKKAMSRLSHVQMSRTARPQAFNSIPETPQAAVDATPDVRGKFRRMEFGSSSRFSSPPTLSMRKSRNNISSPQQRLRMQSGSGNASKLCFSIQKRVALGSPAPARTTSMTSGTGIFDPALREQIMAGRFGNAQRVFNGKRRMSVL